MSITVKSHGRNNDKSVDPGGFNQVVPKGPDTGHVVQSSNYPMDLIAEGQDAELR